MIEQPFRRVIEQPFKDCTRCYMPSEPVTHLMGDWDGSPNENPYHPALCGTAPAWFDARGWRGTGSQEELEVALGRRTCLRCVRVLKTMELRKG